MASSLKDVLPPPLCFSCYKPYALCTCPVFPIDEPSPRVREREGRKYLEAYRDGQGDVLAWLDGDIGVDEHPFAPICPELTVEFAFWCLGHNLTVVGAIKRAELKGKSEASTWNSRVRSRW